MSDATLARLEDKKRQLAALMQSVLPGALDGLEHTQRIDITYTSNAIEGNTLTAGETALVLEKGITVAGKPLKDHLEAVDHAKALDWVLDVAKQSSAPLRLSDVRTMHQLVVAQSASEIAGVYADRPRFVNTSAGNHRFPSPTEVPPLMQDFGDWLASAEDGPPKAAQAHLRLVGIHPFNDGNGRTARLVMNLILARAGYPPIAIRPEDRPAYIAAIELEQSGGSASDFFDLIYRRLETTLDFYIEAARQGQAQADRSTRR
ncbi:Fic family protein [Salmonella enterica subsp. enterica serovar Virchow]|nr:Fic family protein [Salmonella enterica subsp. enterica serovar Virchow]MIL09909.1 Fic family protein [Salmonella enterica subsp. enterica serovar Enteritidis]